MLDKSIRYFDVAMLRKQGAGVPIYHLPAGYCFESYRHDLKSHWCTLQYANDHFDSLEAASAYFEAEFGRRISELSARMYFVKSPAGYYVATATLWDGQEFGKTLPRIHWVLVDKSEQGKGIAKALITKLLETNQHIYADAEMVYLTSQTWSYKALNLYKAFGFEAYVGSSVLHIGEAPQFEKHATEAWLLIEEKIGTYQP